MLVELHLTFQFCPSTIRRKKKSTVRCNYLVPSSAERKVFDWNHVLIARWPVFQKQKSNDIVSRTDACSLKTKESKEINNDYNEINPEAYCLWESELLPYEFAHANASWTIVKFIVFTLNIYSLVSTSFTEYALCCF